MPGARAAVQTTRGGGKGPQAIVVVTGSVTVARCGLGKFLGVQKEDQQRPSIFGRGGCGGSSGPPNPPPGGIWSMGVTPTRPAVDQVPQLAGMEDNEDEHG